MISVINIYERPDRTLTFRPGQGREPRYVVLGVRRKPALRVPVSEASDLAYVRGWELNPSEVYLLSRQRAMGLRLYRDRGVRVREGVRS